jgi:CheY-like chemotaxis protein
MALQSARACGGRILVVEDNFLMAEVLCELLTECGCEVVGPAPRLPIALDLANHNAIDGAFLDVNLAGEYCFPLARYLQEKGVPFVFLTGYGEGTVIPAAFRGVPMVSKPFNPAEIVDITLRYFRLPSPAP